MGHLMYVQYVAYHKAKQATVFMTVDMKNTK